MKCSADHGGCYPPRSKAEVDSTLRDLQNSSYPTKAELNNCFIIHSKYLPVRNGVSPFRSLFFCSPKNNIPSPGFLGQRFNNLQRAALLTSFWRHWFNNLQRTALLTSLIQCDEDSFQIWWTAAGQLVIVNYACGFNQWETGKYFKWIINGVSYIHLQREVRMIHQNHQSWKVLQTVSYSCQPP